jgi:hypothetical protein
MREAELNRKLVVAGPNAPDAGIRPDCGAEVQKRERRCVGGTVTYFFRHARGQGKDCPRQYRPT